MILLRQTLLLQFLLWQCLCYSAISIEFSSETEENQANDDEEYVRVLVGFRDRQEERDYVRAQRLQPRTASGKPKTKINYEFQQTEAVAMEVTRSELEAMKKTKKFQYIEEDILVPEASSIRTRSNTTLQEQMQEMRRLFEFQNYGIELTQAHRTINPDPTGDQKCPVYACVVDSGVFIDNADIPYSRGDGFVDGTTFGAAEGQDWYYPRDTSHGTQVAGIMIATGGNDRGIVGVIPQGPERSNICLRVAKVVPDGEGVAYISALLQASEWCVEQAQGKPVVINLSFAVEFETAPEKAIYQRVYEQNALLVAAAGNSGDSGYQYPAAHDTVISVAAITSGSRRADFSVYNDQVELSAPGLDIQVLQAQTNEIKLSRGTSLASPFVAGLAARVWAAAPRCTNKQVRQVLRDTARRLGNGVPNREYGYGLIRARDAHDVLVNMDCNNVPSSEPTQSPSAVPSSTPSIHCMEHLETCVLDTECCQGYACRRLSTDVNDSRVCRRELSPNEEESRPRLASVDENVCRGGYGGGCS